MFIGDSWPWPPRLRPHFSSHQAVWTAAAALGGGREVTTRWAPAHRPAPAPPLLTAADWAGNSRADALASVALEAAQPPEILLAAALASNGDYLAAVATGAAVLEAQLHWAHEGIGAGPTRFPRNDTVYDFRPGPTP